MDVQTARRVLPVAFGIAVALVAVFASSALLPVAVVGGIAVGLLFWLTPAGPGRERHRARDRR